MITAGLVFMATGRRPYTSKLGLERVGVKTDTIGSIIVDEFSKTNAENIYAVGDVTNRINLTPVAIREAQAFIETIYGTKPVEYDHRNIASAVFHASSHRGVVGLNELQAREVYGENIMVYETTVSSDEEYSQRKGREVFYKINN